MSLKDRITEDMKDAMRAKQAERLSAIRMLLAACKQKEVDERIVLDDAAVVGIVDKLIKQRKDSVAAFSQAGRTDLVDKESAASKAMGIENNNAYAVPLSDPKISGTSDSFGSKSSVPPVDCH